MESISRGDWSRCSTNLCDTPIFNGSPRRKSSMVANKGEESSTLLTADRTSISYGTAAPGKSSSITKNDVEEETPTHRLSLADQSKIMYDEGKSMINLALPVIGTYLLEMLPGITSIMLVGHVQSPKVKLFLDAAALAVMYMNLTALSVGFGLASAMDTLCSQAYGAGELAQRASVYLMTGGLVLSITFCVILVLNLNAATVLMALGQPEDVSALAGTFVYYLLPGIPALLIYELVRKVLQASNIAMPMLYVAFCGNILNAGLGYYWMFVVDPSESWSIMGEDAWLGAAVARTVCNISFPILLVIYLAISGEYRAFWNLDDTNHSQSTSTLLQQAFHGIPSFISFGIPGALQLCFEWWAFECLALLSGLLPDAILAIGTNAILLNLASLVYMFYLGISIAANVRIGNALGANLPQRAALAGYFAFGLATACSLACATIIIVFRQSLPLLFTHDEDIADYCSQLLLIAAAFQLPDSINATVQGIFRGSGRQNVGAVLNFVAYYVVGLPLGAVLAFALGQGLRGLWIGVSVGLLVVSVTGGTLIIQSDWKKLAKDAIRRLIEQ